MIPTSWAATATTLCLGSLLALAPSSRSQAARSPAFHSVSPAIALTALPELHLAQASPTAAAPLPAAVENRILAIAAEQMGQPRSQLTLADVAAKTWDGCMGVQDPRRGCPEIAIAGWQVIVTDGSRSWVYHTNRAGTDIRLNYIASADQAQVTVRTIPASSVTPIAATEIFRLQTTDRQAGIETVTVLLADGQVVQSTTDPQAPRPSQLLTQLSPAAIAEFQTLMATRRIDRFQQLAYQARHSQHGAPDTAITIATAQGGVTQYDRAIATQLPPDLRTVVERWQGLTGVAPTQSPLAARPEYCTAATLRIMPLGDSITHGSAIAGGYRIGLWNRFLNSNQQIDFVGSEANGPTAIDRDHAGYPGRAIRFLQEGVTGWLDTYDPQVVLLMIGTNDVLYHHVHDAYGAPDRLSQLINQITTTSPNTEVLVASIPRLNDPAANELAQFVNYSIPEIVSAYALAGRRVHYVDMYSVLTPADLADGVHPNAAGHDKIAAAWYRALFEVMTAACL